MLKLILLVSTVLVSCDTVHDDAQRLIYSHDDRTELCFAHYRAGRPEAFTNVPCTPAVLRLISCVKLNGERSEHCHGAAVDAPDLR